MLHTSHHLDHRHPLSHASMSIMSASQVEGPSSVHLVCGGEYAEIVEGGPLVSGPLASPTSITLAVLNALRDGNRVTLGGSASAL